ncbi:hypothetical protein CR513_31375, partial [Mucuna pruriens]
MAISAFSTLGFLGKSSSPWYFNSRASNYMTNNAQLVTNIKKYSGNLKIHSTNGNQLPIITTSDISSSLTNVFVSLSLISNLIFVGKLVNNDCRIQFSQFVCLVQDQHSGKIIANGPKVGYLSPIHFLSSPDLSLPLCHGHPNSNVLHNMLKYGFFGNKHTSLLMLFILITFLVNLTKVKFYHFSTHHSNVTQPFDIIHSGVQGRFTWTYFLHSKDEVFSTFKFFYVYIQTQFFSRIKIFHFDAKLNLRRIKFKIVKTLN